MNDELMYKAESGMITNAQGFRPGSERSQSDGFDRPIGREKTGDCTRSAIERTRRLLITFYGKKVIKRPITGADFGIGESRIAYRPYGEIDRVNSDGPDITRFKYTGQVEDSESRLMYYKARYYDPQIGVFTSADSVVQPESPSGMNRFAYVSGNPVNSRDPSGNRLSLPLQGAVIGYFVAPAFGLTREQGAMLGYGMGKNFADKHRGSGLQRTFGRSDVGKGINHAIDQFRGSDIGKFDQKIFQTGSDYMKDPWTTIKNGDIGRSDIGQAGLHALGQLQNFVEHPLEVLQHNDITRSDLGRAADKVYSPFKTWLREEIRFLNNPSEVLAHNDIGRSDVGRFYSKNKACINTGLAIAGLAFGGFGYTAAFALGDYFAGAAGAEAALWFMSGKDAFTLASNIGGCQIEIPGYFGSPGYYF